MSFWNTINLLTSKKHYPSKKEIQEIPEFLLHDYISMNKNFTDLGTFLTCNNIPIEVQFKFLYNALPKMFLRYIKNKKGKDPIEIDELMKKYNINSEVAKEYLKMGE